MKRQALETIQMKDGFYTEPAEADRANEPWVAFDKDDRWGGAEKKYAWFRGEFTVTEEYANKKLVYRVTTGKEGEWDAKNVQFLVFVNGKIKQGLDVNHLEIDLTKEAKLGETFIVDIQGYSGAIDCLSECRNTVCILDDAVERLFYDIYVPLEVIKLLPKEDKNRIDTIKFLTHAINLIDLRQPYSPAFYNSILESIQYLEEKFYDEFCDKKIVL